MTQSKVKEPVKQKIFDEQKLTNVGISLWRDEVLQAITENSGPLAKSNEYQVHYWAVVLRYTGDDGSIVDISIPTVFFNYKQKVSTAHIDFELDDVDTISEQIEVLHNIEAKKILDKLSEMVGVLPAMEYDVWYTELNSLHRHPGGRTQGFSGTDLRKDHTHNTGIVFPLVKAQNRANFASIVAHEGGRTYLARTEYRLATGDVETEEGITYEKGRCVSIIHAPPKEPSFAEKLMGFETEDISYVIHDKGYNPDSELAFVNHVKKWWAKFDYIANTDFVQAENVSGTASKPIQSSRVYNYGYTNQAKPQQHYQKEFDIKFPEKDLLQYLFESQEVKFPTKAEIKEHYKDERLLKLYNEMEEHYYGGQHELTEHSVVYEEVFELHNCILEETSDIMETMTEDFVTDLLDEDAEFIIQDDSVVDFMRKDLLKVGMFTSRDIDSAPATQIVQWYKELFGE